eukprot:TRINITY_DN7877_c0_g2_i12.p1 TRINITY_DN7877_c0_g2~~TRINITY_DN7877_c0_g2_i12.p1  ORF type:complete len:403 (-),score=64.00 TRINITY_DN7877_c0_g2_i12:405-1613(-)
MTMIKILILSLIGYASSQCDSPFNQIDPECVGSLPDNCSPARIFGGVNIQQDRFPYLVSLQRSLAGSKPEWDIYYQQQCGATMIANRVLITAAHCLWDNETYDWRSAKSFRGEPSNEIFAAIAPYCRHMQGRGRFKVVEYFIHPGYDGSAIVGNDIAVLVLESGLDYQGVLANYKGSANVPAKELNKMTIVGWGLTDAMERITIGRTVKPAQQGQVAFMTTDECTERTTEVNASYVINQERMICGFSNVTDTCIADSGGPMMYLGPNGQQNIQIGITSWGPDSTCSTIRGSFPGVYTKVSNYVSWLDETLALIQTNYPELADAIAVVLEQQTPPLAKAPPPDVGTDCLLQAEYGFGEASVPSFYYDSSTSQCVEFIWSGRGGNNNNFATASDCKQTCSTSKK